MDKMEARCWLAIVQLAWEGEEGQKENLSQENNLRAESGRPTVEEELLDWAEKNS